MLLKWIQTMPHSKNIKPTEISDAISFRTPVAVTEILLTVKGNLFPVCPSCKITLEREFQHYCDRCGQCLNWKHYNKAQIIKKIE